MASYPLPETKGMSLPSAPPASFQTDSNQEQLIKPTKLFQHFKKNADTDGLFVSVAGEWMWSQHEFLIVN